MLSLSKHEAPALWTLILRQAQDEDWSVPHRNFLTLRLSKGEETERAC
jgi:hypothetical protein